jgi:hypothetical protein
MIYGLKRAALQKGDLKMDFIYYFIKYFIRFQRIILETLFLFLPFANKALGQNYKVLLKNLVSLGKLVYYYLELML